MSEAIAKIVKLQRDVMTRKRLLSLRDWLALAVSVSALLLATIVALARLRSISLPLWPIIIAVLSLSILAVLIRSLLTKVNEVAAAFLIDQSLNLDDRIASSQLIIQRGGPKTALEEALIEDAAERLGAQRAASLVPLEMRRWHALSLLSVLGLAAALMIPARSLPVNQALASERADIESAGEHLEQAAAEVEQSAAPGTETAMLANEQAELGRVFRRSTATRSEALRRLTALEEKIRKRHDELANTRADEIVSLADRRFDSVLSTTSTRRAKIEDDESQQALPADERAGHLKKASGENRAGATPGGDAKSAASSQENPAKLEKDSLPNQPSPKGPQRNGERKNTAVKRQTEPQKRPQEPILGNGNRAVDSHLRDQSDPSKAASGAAAKPETSVDQKSIEQKANDQRPRVQDPIDPSKGDSSKDGDQKTEQQKTGDQRANEMPAGSPDLLKAVPDSLAEQAAKALPKMSAELLKKAAEMRANKLTPADIERLRRAAESLSRDLTQIEQSKELQKALQEMAQQIRPEQIEQVARELGNQEKIKQELEAAARLLSQNQRGKEMVAGLAEQFAQSQEQSRRETQRGEGKSNMRAAATGARDPASRSDQTSGSAAFAKPETAAERQINRMGRQATMNGKLQQGSAGEYLFLQSRAGAGAARAPYSSVYPQYRREAERSVQRSQVPPNLRSVVRRYFDAINPDANR
jgi:hypothetical protein